MSGNKVELPHLVYEARLAIERMIARCDDPRNLDYDWDHLEKWERHAMNAVLDLQASEKRVASLESALLDIRKDALQAGGGHPNANILMHAIVLRVESVLRAEALAQSGTQEGK